MPTKRDAILDAILTRLTSVLAGAVRSHIRALDSSLPALCMWDGVETASNVKYGKQNSSLQVTVAYAKKLTIAENASKIANEMIGQVVKYVISTDPTLSGSVQAIKYRTSDISYPDADSDWIVGIEVVFDVEYSTNLGDPYN